MLIWHGFDAEGKRVAMTEYEVRELQKRQRLPGGATSRSVHRGKLRVAASAQEAQIRKWPDVAALWGATNKAGLVSGAPSDRRTT